MQNSLYNRFRRITSGQAYFPEIDGIRFLAIMLVVLFHGYEYFVNKTRVLYPGDNLKHDLINNLLSKGDRGVELFFTLSGFILCLPFAHYYLKNGKQIQLGRYYLRRVTRLEPPYIIAITGIFLTELAMHTYPGLSFTQSLQHYFASLTYTHNLAYHRTPIITVVAWSLEIEIQFYLLAPLFFRVLKLPVLLRRSAIVTTIIFAVLLQNIFLHGFLNLTILRFVQYFLIGILLADFYVTEVGKTTLNRALIPVFALCLLIAIVTIPIKFALWGKLLFPFLIGAFYLIVLRNSVVKKIFSIPVISIIGGMCYSIYLLHYPLISAIGRYSLKIALPGGFLPNALVQLALMTAGVLAISALFYLFIERPFMDRKWTDMISKKREGGSNA